ncbi:MAG: hypothetical protein M4D80_13705 [Myxococcota bacterium]|nr:hypothetical protein [Myxococcota bacterium]
MKRTIAVAVLLVACSKGEDKAKDKAPDPSTKTVVEPTPEPPKKKAETTAAAFGKTIGMFGKVANLKWGMSEAEVKAAAPDLVDAEQALELTPEYEFNRLVRIKVKSTSFANLEKLVAEAWGPGIVAKGVIGENTFWFSPSTHTRGRADSSDIELAEYLPLEELLGPDKVGLAIFPKAPWGASLEDVKATYGDKMKPDEKLHHVYFPPTEYDRDHLSVFLLYSKGKGKVDSVNFEIADGPDQQTTFAAFEKKWGKPKMKKSYGSDDEDAIFHSKNPLIQVQRSVRVKAWDVHIRLKDDACGGPCYKGL